MKAVVDFLIANQGILAGVVVAIIDLVFASLPNVKSNGILQGIYNFFKAIVEKPKAV